MKVVRPTPSELPPKPLAEPSDPADASTSQTRPEPAAVTLVGNPWVRVLWVLAPLFILGGLAGQAWSQTLFAGDIYPGDSRFVTSYVLPTLVGSLSPWMVLVGLAALVGVVFLHAVRWRAPE